MTRLGIAGIGVIGPGLDGWRDAAAALTGCAGFSAAAEVRTAVAAGLPPNERRRVPALTRMVLRCCEDTLSECSAEYPATCSVFASSCGDLVVADQILRALALPGKPVSPTLFHNSVHNSPAGYWSKARGDRSGSISVSAHDSSFVAGLLNAAGLVLCDAGPTLLLAYDALPPPALAPFRTLLASFAVGLLLVDAPTRWSISIELRDKALCTTLDDPSLEAMRAGNPAARSLPLLKQLATDRAGTIILPYLSDMSAVIDIESHAAG